RPRFLRRHGFAMDRPKPTEPHQLRDATRAVAIGLDRHRLQRRAPKASDSREASMEKDTGNRSAVDRNRPVEACQDRNERLSGECRVWGDRNGLLYAARGVGGWVF